ncbi:hypothetical protein [Actinacidiphila acidipaludis]|uniref:Uncharacterized protein n=1 Tax=Actinacidiphila acidipaludis TaxID=2873382 RepID=A0ABS7QKI0_9ACTN|nr:hypothetical protein [Streptomyces acidipaludis]MBY8882915.1 hypothetical protein [Streptomyces acidipaludis]
MAVNRIAVATEAPLEPSARSAAAPAEVAPRVGEFAEYPAWPAAAQVWNWAEGAVLFGYGPSPAQFL